VSAVESLIAASIREVCGFALEHEEEFLETVREMDDRERRARLKAEAALQKAI